MKKAKYIIIFLILLPCSSSIAQDMLEEYLLEAAENNPGLKGAFNEYLAALEKVPQTGTLPDPQITFGYFIQPVETRLGPQQARISVMQMFPWFGTLDAKEDAATEMAKSKYEAFEEAKARLLYNVKSNYYNIYFTSKAIDITTENIFILNTFRKLALVKVEASLASTVDVLRVEMDISDLENQLALLKDTYYSQQTSFNNLLHVDENRIISLPNVLEVSDLQLSREAILDSIQGKNHQVKLLSFMESSYRSQEKAASRMGKPNFSIGIDYMAIGKSSNTMIPAGESGTDALIFPMVSVTVPLYRSKYRAMVNEAVYQQEAVMQRKEEKINVLESIYSGAEKDYRDADRRIPLYEIQSERAEKSISILETEYATNGKNFEEMLRMERQLLKYRLELEKALSEKNAAIAFIDYLMGR